jgi:uncharacterized membrane protein YiaA
MTYYLLPISLTFLILYLFSFLLLQKGHLKRSRHVQIWNILILITFLVSVGVGMILIGLLEYDLALPISKDLLYWHVQVAIAMFVISIFHIHVYWKSFRSYTFGRRSSR